MNKNDRALQMARLLLIVEEAAAIAETVKDCAAEQPRDPFANHVLVEMASEEFEGRRLRAAMFNSAELFSEPAWDILLDIYLAQARGKRLLTTKVGALSGVPLSTATRWLKVLEKMNLVRTELDRDDGRRSWKVLTGQGQSALDAYLTRRLVLRAGVPAAQM